MRTMKTESLESGTGGRTPGRRVWWSAWALLLLALGLLLFTRELSRTDEGRYAEVAREMLARGGDFWQMRLMGVRYYEKPPAIYWMIAASMKAFGIDEETARLPLALCILATMALCYRWARREWGAKAAGLTPLVFLSSTGVILGMSFLLTDPPLVAFFSATCFFLFEAYREGEERNRWPWLLAAAAAAGAGVLTKGFIAILLPGAILVGWLLWERRLRDLWRWSLIPIGLVFAAALGVLLWQIEQHNPGFNHRFIVEEHLQRFIGTRAIQGHPEPAWFFIPILPGLLLPWAFFAPRAIRGLRANRDLKLDSFSRYLVVWAAVVFLFFSASRGKLMSYILPMLPPMVLLITRRGMLPDRDASDPVDRRLWSLAAFLPLFCPVGIALFWALARFGMLDGQFGPPAWVLFAPVAALLGVWAWVCFRGYWKTIPGLFLVMAASYATLGLLMDPLSGPEFLVGIDDNSSFYQQVSRQVAPEDELLLCRIYSPAAAFYLQRVPWMYGIKDELTDGMEIEPHLANVFQAPSELSCAPDAPPGHQHFAILKKKDQPQLEREGLCFVPGILAEDRQLVLLQWILPCPLSRPDPVASETIKEDETHELPADRIQEE